jgi:hypothetical protein
MSPKKHNISPIQSRRSLPPSVFIVENFKLLDFTLRTTSVHDLADITACFSNYCAVDLRCVKSSKQSKHDHSHLIIGFSRTSSNTNTFEELSLIVSYSPYGFAIALGELETITQHCGLTHAKIELLHLPKAENDVQVDVVDVLDWAFEHKDEQYMDPCKIREFNMGQRIFNHFVARLKHTASAFRI